MRLRHDLCWVRLGVNSKHHLYACQFIVLGSAREVQCKGWSIFILLLSRGYLASRKVAESVAHESWLSKQQCDTCTARQTLPNCIHDLISTWRTYKCTSRNDSYRRHNIETINRIKFLRKYLDLEFIVEHLYRVSSAPRTSVSCAES